ncbi:MAG: serine hydrolase [Janthinobacterium lividum]
MDPPVASGGLEGRDPGMECSTLGWRMRGWRMRGRHVLGDEQESWTVQDEYAAMIAALLEERAASPASCARELALMEQQQNDRRIVRHLPQAGHAGAPRPAACRASSTMSGSC